VKRRKTAKPLDLDPRQWVPLAEVFQRVRTAFDSIELAANDLHDKLVHVPPQLQAAYRVIVYSAEHRHGYAISGLIERARWEHYKLWGSGDGTVRLRCIGEQDFEDLDRRGVRIFIRRAEFDKLYPPPVAAPAAGNTRPPQRRRGPVTTHDWASICGEIAAHCINPKTGRVQLPKSESKLASVMLDWLAAKGENIPAGSEMREAVRRVLAPLRERLR
jgi:hypothetical protein